MKKRIVALFLAGAMVLSLAACGNKASESGSATASADTTEQPTEVNEIAQMPEYNALDYVELGEYKDLEVTAIQYEVTDEDFQETIDSILNSAATYPEADHDTVEDGDRVDIDFEGSMDGELFDGGSGTGYQLVIGSGTFIDGFEDQLIGASSGEEVTVTVTFPEDYAATDLAGKEAEFKVTINQILADETEVPEYNDEFVESYTGGEFTTTDDFDTYIREALQNEADEKTKNEVDEKLQQTVYANSTVTGLPEGLLDYYVSVYSMQDQQTAATYGMEFSEYIAAAYGFSSEDDYYSALEEQLSSSLIPNMLIQEAIAEKEGLEITDEDIENFLIQYGAYYGYTTVDEVLAAVGVSDISGFIALVGEEDFNYSVLALKTWDFVREEAVITYISENESSGDAS